MIYGVTFVVMIPPAQSIDAATLAPGYVASEFNPINTSYNMPDHILSQPTVSKSTLVNNMQSRSNNKTRTCIVIMLYLNLRN